MELRRRGRPPSAGEEPALSHPAVRLSDILGSVGRWRDATNLSDQLDRTKFLLPGAERKVTINLWAAGDLQAADEAVRAAAGRWPDQRQVWRTRIAYLMYSGRASEALASLEDKSSRPMAVLPDALATVTATARALAGQTGPTEAIAANLRFARANPERALTVAQAVAALGDADETFRLLDGYYFAQGDWSSLAPAGGDADRQSAPLFMPPMRPLWRDSRFAGLLERTGLEAYWRESGTRPDFRTTG